METEMTSDNAQMCGCNIDVQLRLEISGTGDIYTFGQPQKHNPHFNAPTYTTLIPPPTHLLPNTKLTCQHVSYNLRAWAHLRPVCFMQSTNILVFCHLPTCIERTCI